MRVRFWPWQKMIVPRGGPAAGIYQPRMRIPSEESNAMVWNFKPYDIGVLPSLGSGKWYCRVVMSPVIPHGTTTIKKMITSAARIAATCQVTRQTLPPETISLLARHGLHNMCEQEHGHERRHSGAKPRDRAVARPPVEYPPHGHGGANSDLRGDIPQGDEGASLSRWDHFGHQRRQRPLTECRGKADHAERHQQGRSPAEKRHGGDSQRHHQAAGERDGALSVPVRKHPAKRSAEHGHAAAVGEDQADHSCREREPVIQPLPDVSDEPDQPA